MGFLFLWQVMLSAPLTAASGGGGFRRLCALSVSVNDTAEHK